MANSFSEPFALVVRRNDQLVLLGDDVAVGLVNNFFAVLHSFYYIAVFCDDS